MAEHSSRGSVVDSGWSIWTSDLGIIPVVWVGPILRRQRQIKIGTYTRQMPRVGSVDIICAETMAERGRQQRR
jgi:hypothetical protein